MLHVIPSVSLRDGGPSRAIGSIERALCEAGISVTTVTTDSDGPGRRLSHELRPPVANGAVRFYASQIAEFYKIAPSIVPWLWRNVPSFDVVHIHALFSFASVAAGIIARQLGVPYLIRPLGTLTNYGLTQRRPWMKRISLTLLEGGLLRDAAAVHFTSELESREARELGVNMRGVVIPLGVECPEVSKRADLTAEYPEIEGRAIVLFLSRLDPKKNVECLLHAFSILYRNRPDAILVIAGEGEDAYVDRLKRLAASLNIADHIVWLGHVERQRRATAFAAAHLFVLPSLSENFGIAAAEAMLAGIPCILSREIAIAPDVQEAKAGFVVEPTPEDVALAMTTLITNKDMSQGLGKRGKSYAERQFSTAAMANSLIRVYEDVTSTRQRSAA